MNKRNKNGWPAKENNLKNVEIIIYYSYYKKWRKVGIIAYIA